MTLINYEISSDFAHEMDKQDPLKSFKLKFHHPKHSDGSDIIYFCGNSLGLQPINSYDAIDQVMQAWKSLAVEGHFTGDRPWMNYHDLINPGMATLVGGLQHEVHIMNTLTVNLHLMMVSFYRPTSERYKIFIDYSPFPSDRYAIASQIRFHGFDPDDAIIEPKPGKGTDVITLDQIHEIIDRDGDSIALIMIGGVNYYSGQLYPLKEITALARKKGCKVGFDLAHAAGNIPLHLHDAGPDFAIWCTYKYLNAGPGNLGGCFIHERYKKDFSLHRFAGWWGYERATRFLMKDSFIPEEGAEGWTLSNPPVLSMAGIKTSVDIFQEAGMYRLREKSKKLTGYLEYIIREIRHKDIEIITPSEPEQRGCQLSIRVKKGGKELFNRLRTRGIIGDWREPDVIRVAPVPLYNSFYEVFRFGEIMKESLH